MTSSSDEQLASKNPFACLADIDDDQGSTCAASMSQLQSAPLKGARILTVRIDFNATIVSHGDGKYETSSQSSKPKSKSKPAFTQKGKGTTDLT